MDGIRLVANDNLHITPICDNITRTLSQERGMAAISKSFWDHVDIGESDECWEWQRSKTPNGYGRLRYTIERNKYTNLYAHRYAWELVNGPIPDGMFILHKCDNPSCVNPSHLYLGTQSDNIRDRVIRGRNGHPPEDTPKRVGSQVSVARFKEEEIPVIRDLYASGKISIRGLARKYDVSPSVIHSIIHRVTWKHI